MTNPSPSIRRFRRTAALKPYRLGLLAIAFGLSAKLCAVTVDLGSIRFQVDDANSSLAGSVYTFTDEVLIGYAPTGSEAFRPLIRIDGTVEVNTSNTGNFTVQQPYTLYGISADQTKLESLAEYTGPGSETWAVSDLTTNGFDINSGETLSVQLYQLVVSQIQLSNPDDVADTSDTALVVKGPITFSHDGNLITFFQGELGWMTVNYNSALEPQPIADFVRFGVTTATWNLHGLQNLANFDNVDFKQRTISNGGPNNSVNGILYTLAGSATVTIDGMTYDVRLEDFWDQIDPYFDGGLAFLDDQPYETILTIYGNSFQMAGSTFSVTDIMYEGQSVPAYALLVYDYNSQTYQLVGSFYINGSSVAQTFGEGEEASLVLGLNSEGVMTVQSFTAKPAGNVPFNGLTFNLDNLTTTSGPNNTTLYTGTSTVSYADQSFDIEIGTDGLAIGQDGNGNQIVESLTAEVNSDFELYGTDYTVDPDNPLTFVFDTDSQTFQLYGDATLEIVGTSTDVSLGDVDNPGLVIANGTTQSHSFTIATDGELNLGGITITPDDSGLTFSYSATDNTYGTAGGATLTFLDSSVGVSFEADGDAGFVMQVGSDGKLALVSLNAKVSADFTLAGMTFATDQDAGLNFVYDSDDGDYKFYGTADLSLGSSSYEVDFGDEDTPGVEVSNGDVTSLSLTIASDNTLSFHGLTITPDENGFGFTYSEDDDTYSVTGGATASFEDQSFGISLSTAGGNAGLVMKSDGSLVSLDTQVEADFEVYGVSFTVDMDNPLSFIFDSDATEYTLYGSASIDFHNGTEPEEIAVVLGDADTPGLVIDSGTLSSFNFGIQADLTYDGVVIEIGSAAEAFTFVYNPSESLYESYGEVSISYDDTGSVLDVMLGDADAPGIVLSSNDSNQLTLENLNATVSGSFSVDSLDFQVDALTLIYSKRTDYYEIDGTVKVAIESNMLSATFGYDVVEDDGTTTSYPGMRIKDGDLVGVDFIITESISIAGITMDTTDDGIGFSHTGIQDYYYGFGGIKIAFGDQDVEFDAGNYESPGIILSADSTTNAMELEFLLISVSGNLNFYGIELVPDDLTVNYSKLGDSEYNFASNIFEIYGDVTVGVDGVDVSAFLGTKDNPGFTFVDGALEGLDLGISESITLSGLTIETTGDFLGFSYSETSDSYEVFGGLSVSFDGQTLGVQAGTSDQPGMQLVGDEKNHMILQYLDATLTADFSLYGIDINLGDDGVTFVYNEMSDLYEVYGDVDITIEGDEIEAFLGDADTPGFEIEGGTVESVDIGVSTDISLGGFEFKSPEDNPLTITYTADNTTYTVFGQAELDSLWDTIITLGDSDNPGIEIIDNKWDIENLDIEVDKINLGFAQIQKVEVDYSRDSDTDDIIVDMTLDVYIPEFEGDIDATVDTDNGKITSIFLEYKAVGSSEGIEILDTGVDIAELSVSLENLDQPADLIFDGTIGLEFGGQIGIGGTDATLSYIEGEVYVDSTKLTLNDKVFFGAYEDGDDWKSLIFEATAEMSLDWADDIYTLDSDLYLPTDYGIKIEENLIFSKEYIILQSKAEVRVPDSIPLIGGDELGEIDFDLLIDLTENSNGTGNAINSFAAAWVDLNLLFTTEEVGIKYTFHDGSFDYLNSSDVNYLQGQVATAVADAQNGGPTFIAKSFAFDIPEGATSFMISLDWTARHEGSSDTIILPSVWIDEVIAPTNDPARILNDQVSFDRVVYSMDDSAYVINNPPIDQFTSREPGSSDAMELTHSSGVKIISEGSYKMDTFDSSKVDSFYKLEKGKGVLHIAYPERINGQKVEVTFSQPHVSIYYDYADPSIDIESVTLNDSNSDTSGSEDILFGGTTLPINLKYFSDVAFVNETNISLYVDTDNTDYDGTAVSTFVDYQYGGSNTDVSQTLDWKIENINQDPTQEYYIYAQINNNNQKIAYSDYFGPYKITPSIYGRVYDSNSGKNLKGLRVYLDLNGDLDYDALTDRSTISNSNGHYVFDNVPEGTVSVGVIIPYGYESNEASQDIVTTTYISGKSVEVDFDINQLDSISGYVFEDTNSDGIFDDNESGIQGVQLFLDQNNNDTYDASTDIKTITNDKGFWRFYEVEVDTSYDVHILAYPSQLSTSDKSFITVDTTTVSIPDTGSSIPASSELATASVFLATSSPQYTEFGDNNIGVFPGAVDQVRDRRYMTYVLSYFPDSVAGLAGLSLDPDNDGLSNKIEQLLNTDPLTANTSPIPIISIGDPDLGSPGDDSLILVEYNLVASYRYEVQASSDLQTWETIDSFRATETEPVILEINTDLGSEQAFFRIRVSD
ncbi:SdrD B-like domain-containing protein [Rubellicoccus peritrichatus]|uniref:SdrD B-like domain-containing protein n=1 Tax=Rubellicoccus peritrichatus TaxID=3080537 RepID=A0AAQ3QUN5_9BACT|nr:SdrD B-like domain-containing protein [Puniceicoccus sp. CR14]WOO42571.1 SdrD B-like domain-containing protein [Puniceicoccus sp. CR14]